MADVIPANCKPATSYTSQSLHEPVKIRFQDGDDDNLPTILPDFFKQNVKKYGDRPALVSQEAGGESTTLTFQEYYDKTRLIARGFIKLGLEARTSCGIIALTCPEWFFTNMGAIFGGGVSAGIYSTNSAEAVHYILDSSNATICVVDDQAQMAKLRSIKHRLPKLKSVVQIHGPYEDFLDTEEGYYSWAKLEEIGASDDQLELHLEERLKDVVANECCTLIYTSGTVGMPKGVMISHDNIITASKIIVKSMPNVEYGHEVIVSYLPLSHVAGQLFDLIISMLTGACIYFADKNAFKGTLIKTIIKARPTRFFGVPRVYEKMQEKLMTAERDMPWLSKLVLTSARTAVENYHLALMENDNRLMCSWKHWLGAKVTQKVKTALGFDQCKSFFTGAAPISVESKRFFLGYDMVFSEVYGLSETCGPTNVAWTMETLTSCGKPLLGVELKLENTYEKGQGEICVRCRFVFMGYLNDSKKTKEALTADGWFRTGDFGYTDSANRLYITGRLKELIVTSGGENIPPVHIEQRVLEELPGLNNAMLIGDKRKFLTMLVTIKTDMEHERSTDNLNAESLEWMKSLELPYVTLAEILDAGPCPKVLQSIQEGIDRANANAISNAQKVQKFAILPHDFSVSTGELGPTLKLRRNIVLEKYADIIESFYK